MTTLSTPFSLGGSDPPATAVLPLGQPAGLTSGRVLIYALAVLAFLLTVLVLLFHAYVAWSLSHPSVATLASNPKTAKNLDYDEIAFPSADSLVQLQGWWVPSADSRQTVVLSHGYGANREEYWVPMYDLAELLHNLGYNVLMFDYGFANTADPSPATGGVRESQQLIGAIRFARAQGSDELVVWGFSMGAGTALQAALHKEPVEAMILDSTFLPDEDTIYYNIRNYANLPKYPTVQLLRSFFPLVSGSRLEQIPSTQIQNTAFDFPIFLIHSTADDKSPTYLAENVAKAQTDADSTLWIVPDALHEMIYRTHTEEYVSRLTAFLDNVRLRFAAADSLSV